jgi:hypothetical protein
VVAAFIATVEQQLSSKAHIIAPQLGFIPHIDERIDHAAKDTWVL